MVIFDLDNCLADDSHRVGLINWSSPSMDGRYDAYHAAAVNDKPCNKDEIHQYVSVVDWINIYTARPEKYRRQTEEWIANNLEIGACPVSVTMRPNGDRSPSAKLKAGWADTLVKSNVEILAAYDDRDDVLKEYGKIFPMATKIKKLTSGHSFKTEEHGTSPSSLLREAAELFEERNAQYGSGYLRYGGLLMALFPEGGVPGAKTPAEAIRLNLIMMCLAKLQRYAHNFGTGGHKDSARDLQVYGAMLEENTK